MKELREKRQPSCKVFDLGEGRQRLEIHGRPVHAPSDPQAFLRGEACEWDEIDLSLVQRAGHWAVARAWNECEILSDAADIGNIITTAGP